MKNKNNKKKLSALISSISFGSDITLESQSSGAFLHEEADITMITYLLQVAESNKIIRVLSNDTDVLVLLIYWVWKAELHSKCEVQMDCWNGEIININETCKKLGPKCLQLLGMHSLTGCDNVSYPFSKGKISALNILLSGNFPALDEILGEENATENISLIQHIIDKLEQATLALGEKANVQQVGVSSQQTNQQRKQSNQKMNQQCSYCSGLFDTVIPFISFYNVPVFSEERIDGSFLLSCSLSLYFLYQVDSEMLVQVKHSGWVFKQVFITKRERGG